MKKDEEIISKIINIVLKLSPLILFIVGILGKSDDKIKIMDLLIGAFCAPSIIYYLYHTSYESQEKTGRSFKSKSGIDINEYKTVYNEGKPMKKNQKSIMKLYFIIGIFLYFIAYLFKL